MADGLYGEIAAGLRKASPVRLCLWLAGMTAGIELIRIKDSI